MKNFLRHYCLSENLVALGKITIPRRVWQRVIAAIIFLFPFSFTNAQNFLSPSYAFTADNLHQPNKISFSFQDYFGERDDHSVKNFAPITSLTDGNWSHPSIWAGGQVPGSSDDVIIDAGTTVTVDVNSAANNITINNGGTLNFPGSSDLDIYGDFTNDGTFTAGTGTVSFKGAISATISGSSNTAFNNIIANKGNDLSSVLEANGSGAISNTGNITLTNGLLQLTSGTFQFKSDPLIPASAGLWINGATLNSAASFTYHNNGLIKVTTGTANFGTSSGNDLGTGGGGELEIDGGNVNVSGSLINTAGNAIITGGTINLATVGNSSSAQGSFQMSVSSRSHDQRQSHHHYQQRKLECKR